MNSRVFRVGEFEYAIGIFKGAKGVATATKFRQKSAKIAVISVLCKKSRNFSSRVFGVRKFKYAIRIFKGAKVVAMTAKFRQK